jgi:ribosome-binding ATPase
LSLQIGIVGLPNVGKSTLFNALTKSKGAEAANYPFCTINPNVGIVEVPDDRLQQLASVVSPEKIIPAIVEFVDIAGLVKGASEGEGLGNKFLAHIRECDAILQVVRHFEDGDIQHVHESVDPKRDIEIIQTELILADLQTIEKAIDRLNRESKSGDKELKEKLAVAQKIQSQLNESTLVINISLNEDEEKFIHEFQLLTSKPLIYAINCSEDQIGSINISTVRTELGLPEQSHLVPVSAQVEQELNELADLDRQEFLESLGLKESSLNALIKAAYSTLGLQTYFTAGVKEVRAWTIHKGDTAPKAAGVIHTDFEKGFIRAEITKCEDFVELGGETGARTKGKLRVEGKEYIMQEGDVVHFLFNN